MCVTLPQFWFSWWLPDGYCSLLLVLSFNMNDVITRNSSVIFQFISFLLWTKGSHQSPNFDIFKRKFLTKIFQIPHVLFQITSQFFFRYCMTLQRHEKYLLCASFTYLGQKQPITMYIFEIFKCSESASSSCQFWTGKSITLQTLHHSSLSGHIARL